MKDLPQSLIQKIIRLNKVKINKKRLNLPIEYKLATVTIYNIEVHKEKTTKKILLYKPSIKEIKNYDDFVIEDNDKFIITA